MDGDIFLSTLIQVIALLLHVYFHIYMMFHPKLKLPHKVNYQSVAHQYMESSQLFKMFYLDTNIL